MSFNSKPLGVGLSPDFPKAVKPIAHTTPRVMGCCKHCHSTTGRHEKGANVIVIICSDCWEFGLR